MPFLTGVPAACWESIKSLTPLSRFFFLCRLIGQRVFILKTRVKVSIFLSPSGIKVCKNKEHFLPSRWRNPCISRRRPKAGDLFKRMIMMSCKAFQHTASTLLWDEGMSRTMASTKLWLCLNRKSTVRTAQPLLQFKPLHPADQAEKVWQSKHRGRGGLSHTPTMRRGALWDRQAPWIKHRYTYQL